MIAAGAIVTLTTGTRVGIETGERFEWGGKKYDWYLVGQEYEGYLVGVEFDVLRKTGPHATMNGGGFDFTLQCRESGLEAIVRTTLARPESATFTVQS